MVLTTYGPVVLTTSGGGLDWALLGPLLPLPGSPSWRTALELLEPIFACFDPHPMTGGCKNMKAQLSDFWGATYTPEFPFQETRPEIIFLLGQSSPVLLCPLLLQGALKHTLNKSFLCEPSSVDPGKLAADQYLLKDAEEEPYLKRNEQNIQQKGHKRQNLAKDMFSLAHKDFKKCEGSFQHVKTGKFHRKTQISPGLGKSDLAALSLRSYTAAEVRPGGPARGCSTSAGASPHQPTYVLLLHNL